MSEPFGVRLRAAMDERGPLCVGLDPHAALLDAWGLPDTAYGLERFTMTVVESLADRIAVIKPQSAFFERHGSAGVAVLERAISATQEYGALVLLDVKRGDIGSTVDAYADAYLGPSSSLAADAITVHPYLGFGALQPFISMALEHNRGVFVVTLSSNPEGREVQQASQGAVTVAGAILRQIAELNGGIEPMGSIGAVVGATTEDTDDDLNINGPLLAPGFGAQGGTVDDLRRVFGSALPNVLPATSRAVLSAGPDPATLQDVAAEIADSLAS
ncbi:MAG TPA: orotidine-5'-phosphate decarboxylase [Nocardioidaceae bacterium]|nr:orotidine-5'-phosphate decarboxylase [Nocardioidaceae bacterium]